MIGARAIATTKREFDARDAAHQHVLQLAFPGRAHDDRTSVVFGGRSSVGALEFVDVA